MKKVAAYRIFADLCFYFSILSIFPALRPWQLPMALFAAACLLVSLIAVHCPYRLLRLLLSLLPGLCFLKAPLAFPLVFPALGWFYVILVLTIGSFRLWPDEYRRSYRVMLVVCLCALAANVAQYTVMHGTVISWPGMIYALLFLCFGVFAMRGMQMNANMGLRWELANLGAVVGVPVLAIGSSLLLYLLLGAIRPVVNFLFRPIGNFVIWLFQLLFPGSDTLTAPAATPAPTPPPAPVFVEEPAGYGNSTMDDLGDRLWKNSPLIERAATIGGYVVLGLLLLLAVLLIIRHARRSFRDEDGGDLDFEEAEETVPARRKRRGAAAAPVRGNASQIRRIYRQYMELMQQNGVRIQKDSTSLDILDEAEQVNLSPAAKTLRELYLKARYAEASAVTDGDVQEAQRCLQEIRDEFQA